MRSRDRRLQPNSSPLRGFYIQVIGITSEYMVPREQAQRMLDRGRASVVSSYVIRIVGGKSKVRRKEWVKKQSGDVCVMQLVDSRQVRPRYKPKHLE